MRPGCVVVRLLEALAVSVSPTRAGAQARAAISLESWQRDLVDEFPGDFLRGLFHSDGCRVNNWASRSVAGELKRYYYPRWHVRQQLATDILASVARDPRCMVDRPVAPVELEVSSRSRHGLEWRGSTRSIGLKALISGQLR